LPAPPPQQVSIQQVEIPLDRDLFLRTLVRELAGTLQEVVGVDEASGFISVVGQQIGEQVNDSYKAALRVDRLSREQLAEVLVDLKRRIQGSFYILEETPERIVFGNRDCPFGDKVLDRPAMCMMTSNVFGVIAAENLGYARVDLDKTIAQHHGECRVVLSLTETADAPAGRSREYFRSV
jgi:predicted ArsR family transcriptional regulator